MKFFKALSINFSIHREICDKFFFLSFCTLLASCPCISAELPDSPNAMPITPLSPPEGQCALSKENVHEAIIISRLEKKYEGKYHVLMVYVDCKDLKDVRQGKKKKIKSYGEFLLPVNKSANEIEQNLPDPIHLNELMEEIIQDEIAM